MPEQCNGILQLELFVFRQTAHDFGEGFDAALPAFPHQTDSFGSRFEADAAAVFGGVAADKAGMLEAGDDAAHCGWTYLLGAGELAERFGSAENEDGKRGELRGADATFAVTHAQPAEQVNGRGVQLVGDFGWIWGWRKPRLGGSLRGE